MRRTAMTCAATAAAALLLANPQRAAGQADPAGLSGMVYWFLGGPAYEPPPNPDPPGLPEAPGLTSGNEVVQNEDVVPIEGDSHPPVDEVMDARNEPRPALPSGASLSFAAFRPSWPARMSRGGRAAAALVKPFAVLTARAGGEMEMRVYSANGLSPTELDAFKRVEFVASPVTGSRRSALEKYVKSVAKPGSGVHVTTILVRNYCVEAPKLPPVLGTLYVAGDRAEQEQFKPMRLVRRVGEFAASHGFLRPEGDPTAYGRFITQYAVWTKLEHWDQARFTDEFLARAKQAAVARHKPFADDTARALRAVAPHRWREVQFVLQAADQVDQRMRASAGGAR